MFQNPRLCKTVCAISLLFAAASAPAFAATIEIEHVAVPTASQSDTQVGCGWLAGKRARVSHNNYSRELTLGDDPSLTSTTQLGLGSATAPAFASGAGSPLLNPISAPRRGAFSAAGFGATDPRFGTFAATDADPFSEILASLRGNGSVDPALGGAGGAGNGIFTGLGEPSAPGPIGAGGANDTGIAPVPVPPALPLLLAALGGLGLAARRRWAKAPV